MTQIIPMMTRDEIRAFLDELQRKEEERILAWARMPAEMHYRRLNKYERYNQELKRKIRMALEAPTVEEAALILREALYFPTPELPVWARKRKPKAKAAT